MSDEFEEKFIRPIINASYPGTLAGLDLAVLQVAFTNPLSGPNPLVVASLAAGALGFLIAALSIFAYTLYPTRKKLWTTTALAFLAGLFMSILSVVLLLFFPPTQS